ncbi:hypothetical protein PS3A_11660 [Pseudomonas sp. 3A(2025)]
MDIREIRQLATWLGEAQLSALELKRPGLELFIKRSQVAHIPRRSCFSSEDHESRAPAHERLNSPQAGLFILYRPDERSAYAQPGETIEAGQLLGLLKIGGLYLPVRSSMAGKLIRFIAQDGEQVGYGQPLLELEAC